MSRTGTHRFLRFAAECLALRATSSEIFRRAMGVEARLDPGLELISSAVIGASHRELRITSCSCNMFPGTGASAPAGMTAKF